MKKVVVLKIEEYNLNVLKERIKETLIKHFPPHKFLSPQDRILLKPNLLMEAQPEEAIVTHPIFIEAIGTIFKEMNYKVAVADSPGGFVDNRSMNVVYEATGVKDLADRCGFELLFPTRSIVNQHIPFCWWLEGFKMINLPKLKTHDIMVLTLAVKNLYGCIGGLHKSHLHKIYPKTESLAKLLLKLYAFIKPQLNIIDGILALEGNGPAKNGKPKKMNMVVIGEDALYTDYAIGKLLGLKVSANPLIKKAKELGLFNELDLELISEISSKEVSNFRFPAAFALNYIPTPLISLLKVFFKFRPSVDKTKCTGCCICEKICPKQAIEIVNERAVIDYALCIMCMCCAEMCKFGAVGLNKSSLLKAIDYLRR